MHLAPKSLVGDRIRKHRLVLGLTQAQLAERVGITRNAIGDLETGEKMPSPKTAVKLCNIFRLSLDDLYTYRNFNETIIFSDDITDTLGRRIGG